MAVALATSNIGGVVHDLQAAKARRFLQSLGEHSFVAVVLDEETGQVRMYTKGVTIKSDGLRRIRSLLDEMETNMIEEPDGDEDP